MDNWWVIIGFGLSILTAFLQFVVKIMPVWLFWLCIAIGIVLIIWGFYLKLFGKKPVRPLLRIKPLATTVSLDWPEKEIIPKRTKENKSPFSILLTNVGNARAIDVEIVFQMSSGVLEIKEELQSTNVFPGFEIEDDNIRIPLQVGNPRSSTPLLLGTEDRKKIDAINFEPGHNERLIEFPRKTKNSLILWLVSQSYRLGRIRHLRWNDEMAVMGKLFEEKNWKKLNEYHKSSFIESILSCPDIKVILSYKNITGHKFSETQVIRSIYQITSTPFWVIDGEQRYFTGGFGLLSFEDNENPSEGYYNTLNNINQEIMLQYHQRSQSGDGSSIIQSGVSINSGN